MCEYCGYNHKLFWPLTLIFVGTLVMMLNVGVLPPVVWRFWPVLLVIVGLIGLSGSCDNCAPKTKAVKKSKSRSRR